MPKKKKSDPIADTTSMFGDPEPEKKADDTVSVEDQIKALTTSVEGLTKANETLVADNKTAQDLTMTLLATPATAAEVVVPVAQAPFPAADQLPDPVEDPKGYFAAVNKHITDGVATQMAQFRDEEDQKNTATSTRATQVSDLWDRFSKGHEDLAKYKPLVNVAAQEVVEKARAKGIDGEQFMFGAGSDRFLDEVAESVTATLKSIRDEGKEDDKGGENMENEGGQPNPALGMLPGLPVASGAGGGDGMDKEPAGGDGGLVADIKKGQQTSVFF